MARVRDVAYNDVGILNVIYDKFLNQGVSGSLGGPQNKITGNSTENHPGSLEAAV